MIHRSDERPNRRAPVLSTAVLVLTAHLALPATAFGTGLAERGGRIAAQTVIESEAPRDPDLVLADEPLVRIGMVDGPEEYLFGNVTGAIRLEDGSIVVADEQSYAVRRYDATGQHMWTSGRQGEGPGEYGGLRLLRGCPGAAITVFDWHLDRVTQLEFPAYEALLPLADGSVWVKTHGWRAPDTEQHLLGPDGTWIQRLTMPSGSTLLDAGRDWVLLRRRGELDEHIVAVYRLVESGAS